MHWTHWSPEGDGFSVLIAVVQFMKKLSENSPGNNFHRIIHLPCSNHGDKCQGVSDKVRDGRGVLCMLGTSQLPWSGTRTGWNWSCFLSPPIFKYKRNGFAAFLLVLCLLTGAVYAFWVTQSPVGSCCCVWVGSTGRDDRHMTTEVAFVGGWRKVAFTLSPYSRWKQCFSTLARLERSRRGNIKDFFWEETA